MKKPVQNIAHSCSEQPESQNRTDHVAVRRRYCGALRVIAITLRDWKTKCSSGQNARWSRWRVVAKDTPPGSKCSVPAASCFKLDPEIPVAAQFALPRPPQKDSPRAVP